jgi:hypothetical protein
MNISDLTDEQRAEIKVVKDGLLITKVVATRAVKTKGAGDFFVGMSAAWDSIQEDAGGLGADQLSALDDDEQRMAHAHGMTSKQAKIAGLILGMQVDLQAGQHALGGGAISENEYAKAERAIKRKYGQLLAAAVVNGSRKRSSPVLAAVEEPSEAAEAK